MGGLKQFEDLKGLTFTKVYHEKEYNRVVFEAKNVKIFLSPKTTGYHDSVIDICGDLEDLVESPILSAYESTDSTEIRNHYGEDIQVGYFYYHISTLKGSVTLSWDGDLEGYYTCEAYLAVMSLHIDEF